jgi:hypothetical protein
MIEWARCFPARRSSPLRYRQRGEAVGRPQIGTGAIRIAAAQGAVLPEFAQKIGNGGGIEGGHESQR